MKKIIFSILIALTFSQIMSQPSIAFLEETNQNEKLTSLSIKLEMTPSDALRFLMGFNTGFEFFLKLPHAQTCSNEGGVVFQDSIEFVRLISQIEFKDLQESLKQIFNAFAKIHVTINHIQTATEDCTVYSSEFNNQLNILLNVVQDEKFILTVLSHITINYNKVTQMAADASNKLKEGSFEQAGQAYGELVRYVVFPNL